MSGTKAKKKAKAKAGKKKRGSKSKPEPEKKEPRHSHLTKLRCRRCGAIMNAVGTISGGRIKRWKCPAPICGRTAQTVGEEIRDG